jgi:hypothetical protein
MPPDLRRQLANLLILAAFGLAVGRILSAELVYEPSLSNAPGETNPTKRNWPAKRPNPMPTFGSNDRSRWATVRALVDDGTFVVGRRDRTVVLAGAVGPLAATNVFELAALCEAGYRMRTTPYPYPPAVPNERWQVHGDSGIVFEDGWGTVDKVLHPSRLEYYSTKPPLLQVLVAGEYWLLQKATGWTLRDQPQPVVRTILVTINALPLLLYLGLLARLLGSHAATDWGRFFVLTCAAFGTLVTPFLVTFNNHTVGTFSAAVAVYAVCRVWEGKDRAAWHLLAGLAAGFMATNELPALALAGGLGLVLLWRSPARALLLYAPAVVVPLAALAATNYLAIGEVTPAYEKFGGPWYKYEGSHWAREPLPGQKRRGIDFAREHESQADYAVNLLVGHHGVFSLTPFTLLTVVGVVMGLLGAGRGGAGRQPGPIPIPGFADPPGAPSESRTRPPGLEPRAGDATGAAAPLPSFLFPLTAVVSLVVVGFYVFKSDNYGGWSNGPRWLMWLTPLWLLTMLPAADWLGRRRWGRAVAGLLLVLSVLSVSYMAWNPWRHPWLYNWMEARGWVSY